MQHNLTGDPLFDQTVKATDEIRVQVTGAQSVVSDVATAMTEIAGMVERISAEELTDDTRHFVARIRTTDRRSEPRQPTAHPASIVAGNVVVAGTLRDVSAGGAALLLDAAQLPQTAGNVVLKIPAIPFEIAANIAGRTANRVNLAFPDATEGERLLRWFVTAETHARTAA